MSIKDLRRFLLYSVLAVSVVTLPAAHADDWAVEPEGYRLENYDDIVPETLTGATVVDAEELAALQENETVIVVDVIPEQRRPDFLPENQIWIPVPHKGLAGSLWLPDTGYGVLSEVTERYLFDNLEITTSGDKNLPVAFYCRANCWMSWNAAKRVLKDGYTRVYWFADGTDGWFEAGFEFDELTPAEGDRQ